MKFATFDELINIDYTDPRWYALEDLPNEVWKDIKSYEGLYQISNYGRVKSLERLQKIKNRYGSAYTRPIKTKILSIYRNNRGYCMIQLYNESNYKHFLIHRLVAIHFLENSNNYPEVDHDDENKNNNRVTNLVWCDRLYNNTRGVQNKEGRRNSSKFRMKSVNQYSLKGKLLNSFDGLRIAEEETGINNRDICACCKGRVQTAGGYIWRYKDE